MMKFQVGSYLLELRETDPYPSSLIVLVTKFRFSFGDETLSLFIVNIINNKKPFDQLGRKLFRIYNPY